MATQDRPESLGALQEEGAIWIEYMDIRAIRLDPDNPKDHDIGALTQSVARFGYLNPMATNEETGTLVYGHGRLETLLQGMDRGEQPPAHVFARHGTWYAPVVRGIHLDPESGLAYIIADNQMTFLGGWDEPKLLENLKMIAGPTGEGGGLRGTGFTPEDMDHLARALLPDDGLEPLAPIDQAERLASKWGTAEGQLWTIPSVNSPDLVHRVVCGDATSAEHVALLMGGRQAAVVMTDPPYGIALKRHRGGKGKHGDEDEYYAPIGGDALVGDEFADFLVQAFLVLYGHTKVDASWYVWHSAMMREVVRRSMEAAHLQVKQEIIWIKDNFLISRQDYQWQHESALYGWGKKHVFYGDRRQSTVWEIKRDRKHLHPTIKPVALYMRACRNNSRQGDIIADTFAGTGPAILAAERTGRMGYCLELAPKYVAVILQRCREIGLEPRLVET